MVFARGVISAAIKEKKDYEDGINNKWRQMQSKFLERAGTRRVRFEPYIPNVVCLANDKDGKDYESRPIRIEAKVIKQELILNILLIFSLL